VPSPASSRLVVIHAGQEVMQRACAKLARSSVGWSDLTGDARLDGAVAVLVAAAEGVAAVSGYDNVRAALAFWACETDPAVVAGRRGGRLMDGHPPVAVSPVCPFCGRHVPPPGRTWLHGITWPGFTMALLTCTHGLCMAKADMVRQWATDVQRAANGRLRSASHRRDQEPDGQPGESGAPDARHVRRLRR